MQFTLPTLCHVAEHLQTRASAERVADHRRRRDKCDSEAIIRLTGVSIAPRLAVKGTGEGTIFLRKCDAIYSRPSKRRR